VQVDVPTFNFICPTPEPSMGRATPERTNNSTTTVDVETRDIPLEENEATTTLILPS